MPRYAALLRAINVGGHVVRMEQLRALFASLKFDDVETVIASGNVLFSAGASDPSTLEERIEHRLERTLGYPVVTFVRTAPQIEAIAARAPFDMSPRATDSLYVAFLKSPPGATAREWLVGWRTEADEFHVDGRELYWRRRGAATDSAFSGALLEKRLAGPATLRNVTTVRRLAARIADS